MIRSLLVLAGFLALTGYAFTLSAKAGSLALLLTIPWCAFVAEDVTTYSQRGTRATQLR
jgi:hypothetical protein